MHLKRWLTSLVALPILLYVLLKGSTLSFMLLLALVSSTAHWEFLTICGLDRTTIEKVFSLSLGLLLLLSFSTARPYLPSFFLVFAMLAYFLYYLLQYESFPHLLPELALSCLGLFYVPYLLGHFLWLRQLPEGKFWLLWLLLVIFAGDTAAFYSGRWFGVKKLYPQVSPGKTVAGSLGGLAASLAAGIGFGLWLPLGASLHDVARSGFPGSSHRSMWRSFRIHVKTTGSGKRCFQHFTRSWRAFGSVGQLVLYRGDSFLRQALYFLNWQ